MQAAIAVVQLDVTTMRPELNLERMESFIVKAAKLGAHLVVFPEDAVTGPLGGQTAFIEQAPGYLAHFQALAVKHGVDLVPGTWTVREGGALYNTAYYINRDGTVAGSYRKVNLWETEKLSLTPGPGVSVFPTAYGLVGLIVCWDIAFPAMFSEMNRLGVEMVISPTYWSFTPKAERIESVGDDEILLIDSLCTARAFENDIVLVYCNAAGELEDGSAVLSGRSQVTHPADKVLCKAEENEEEMLFVHVTHTRAQPAAGAV